MYHFSLLFIAPFMFLSCSSYERLYNSNRISNVRELSHQLENNLITQDEILFKFSADSLLFLNTCICDILNRKYSKYEELEKLIGLCKNVDYIFNLNNKDLTSKTKSILIQDSINKLFFSDQLFREVKLESYESIYNPSLNRKSKIDSIDSISMKFLIHYYNKKLFEVYLNSNSYSELFILLIHNIDKRKNTDMVILNLILRGFEKGQFTKSQILFFLMKYTSSSTGKIVLNYDFLLDEISTNDSYQIKLCKQVIKRVIKI